MGEPLWFCDACGAAKPTPEPGTACPAGCGSRVTSSRPPATVTAALAILVAHGWEVSEDVLMATDPSRPPLTIHHLGGQPMLPTLEELTDAGYVSGYQTTVTSPLRMERHP